MLIQQDIYEKKKALRKEIKSRKATYTAEEKKEKSKTVWQQIEQLPTFATAKVVMLYWSMEDEVYTHDFIMKWHQQKTILLPAVAGEHLHIKVFRGMQSMQLGKDFGILEPTGEDYCETKGIDMIIVPGVAFDHQNNRMGRGRGFYDRLLNRNHAVKIGVCFDFQYLPNVPTDENDIKMDMVIVELENKETRA